MQSQRISFRSGFHPKPAQAPNVLRVDSFPSCVCGPPCSSSLQKTPCSAGGARHLACPATAASTITRPGGGGGPVDLAITPTDCFFIWRDQSSGQCSVTRRAGISVALTAAAAAGRRSRRKAARRLDSDTWVAAAPAQQHTAAVRPPCAVFASTSDPPSAAQAL